MTIPIQNRFHFTGSDTINYFRMLSAALLAGASIAAQAQSGDEAAPTHWRFGFQFGSVQDHHNTEPVAQVSLGYDIDRTWSVEALANVSLLFIRSGSMDAGDREFNSAVGARVLATLPLSERWNLVGGLGVVSFNDEIGNGPSFDSTKEHKTSPMASVAAMFHKSRRWSFGVEASSFTQAHTFNVGLRSQFHF